MNMGNESASISRWIINLGGGEDPSWASSIVRTVIAIAGTYAFVEYNISYGYLTYPAKLATSVLATIFVGSLLVKVVKSLISFTLKQKRMKRANQHWNTLNSDEHTIIAKFMTEKKKRLQLRNNNPHPITPLIEAGILKDVTGRHDSSDFDELALYELSEGMWDLALQKWETETFREPNNQNLNMEQSQQKVKELQAEREAEKNRIEQLENELIQARSKQRELLMKQNLSPALNKKISELLRRQEMEDFHERKISSFIKELKNNDDENSAD